MTDTIEQVAESARKGFDLKARLEGRNRAEGKHTVFTDDKLAKQVLEKSMAIAVAKSLAMPAQKDPEGNIVSEEIKVDQKLVDELTAEKDTLVAELRSTGITFHFRAIPRLLVDKANAATKLAFPNAEELGTKDEADAHFFALLFADAVTKVEDHAAGESASSISIEDAVALREQLEDGEWVQLNVAFSEVQFKNSIAHQITDSPDF